MLAKAGSSIALPLFSYQKEIPAMEETGTTITRHDVLLAAAIMAASPNQDSSIEDISSFLFKLKNRGIDLGDIALRRVPGGFYSEDIEALLGHYLAAGYATHLSPVRLTDEGKQVLSDIISNERRENRSAIEQIEAVLGKLKI
jgi:hypothetical protein